jgi:2'-5' RNA ligase
MIRLFAALAAPPEIAEGLSGCQQGLEGARWRPAESLHITLRFFGDLAETLADDLDLALSQVSGEPLRIELAGVGCFGEGPQVHAVWAGVAENAPLRRLARRCETAARRVGLKPDKRAWRPHVTLAYLTRPDPRQAAAWIQRNNLVRSPIFEVAGFGLYSSWATTEGSRYRLERSYPLG